eukprot:45180-Pyramimonas_sp.AAC.1
MIAAEEAEISERGQAAQRLHSRIHHLDAPVEIEKGESAHQAAQRPQSRICHLALAEVEIGERTQAAQYPHSHI